MSKQKKQSLNWEMLFERVKKKRYRPKKQAKDILFRLIFGNNRQALLELYNALSGTHYTDAEELQIVTLENALYIEMKNDLAFILSGSINLYEHQATMNPNMPVRFLIYLAEEYQNYIENSKRSVYGNSVIELPTPQCIVFYNGIDEMDDEAIIRLSDSFIVKTVDPAVEVIVRIININYGHNEDLMKGCDMLHQYSQFVEITRQYSKTIANQTDAMNRAIDYCIDQGILADILKKNRGEVLGSILYEFDAKKYERTLREEGYEAGLQESRRELQESRRELQESRREFILYLLNEEKSDAKIMEIASCTQEEIDSARDWQKNPTTNL